MLLTASVAGSLGAARSWKVGEGMTPFVPLAAGAQAEILYLLGGKVVENRLWFVIDNPPAGAVEFQALADGVASWHDANVMPLLSSDVSRFSVFVRDWTYDHSTADGVNGSLVAGGVASPSYSANVSVVVPFRWPLQMGRRKRNKHYIPGIPDSEVTVNTVSFALCDALFEAYVALIDDAPGWYLPNRWRWYVTSSWEGNTLRSEMLAGACIGPPRPFENQPDTYYKLGQRRRRLPV